MLKSLILYFTLGASLPALAFPVHSSPSAETLMPMKVAFQPYPGSNPLQDYAFLLNSLSIGIWDGFEVGTVPLMWTESEQTKTSNFNLKNRLFRIGEWTMALGLELIQYEIKAPEIRQHFDSMSVTQMALALEYRPLGSDFEFRYNMASAQLNLRNYHMMKVGDTDVRLGNYAIYSDVDHYLDIQMIGSNGNMWVMGLTRNHDWLSGLANPNSHAAYGIGFSHGWKIRDYWISGLSLGLHYREGSGVKTLASFVF